ncbi:immunoglobulin superfamily member 3-like [Thalassophryne amazonica]|uniref:immunoglobulin superfamily member 3-like n=1 Tax=Thalassophryne amazonica TaxID=390379 RepID=UPI001470F83D|nr:immunoglobulin superfamily member 3-like [Thalassophryne amazonica]
MRSWLRSVQRLTLLFCLCFELLLHCGEAQVQTEIQPGPLYRVMDSYLSISCDVSGFANAQANKEFQFSFFSLQNPSFPIQIISTHDKDFTYAMYGRRVRSKDITLEYVSPNSVIFKIQRLQKSDEGEYECSIVNSESVYFGAYSDKTTVKVIDNSLRVSSPVSTTLRHNEGDALTLKCQASSNTIQHTHLSLAWYLQKDGEDNAQTIISLDRDFSLRPGDGFEGRYQAGLIGLDKIGEATYRLTIAQLELSDQGRIYCQAQEWIQDPDHSWYAIADKTAEETNVTAKAVAQDESSLVVTISVQKTTLQEGQELSMLCSVDSKNLVEKFFTVAWVRGSVELARIGPTGVLSVGPEYSSQEQQGDLKVARISNRDYRLILDHVRTLDQGQYLCRAWTQERDVDGGFTPRAAQYSNVELVSILAVESGLSVKMERNVVDVNEGSKLQLTCKVEGAKGLLSISWQRKSTSISGSVFTDVISLNLGGVMRVAAGFQQRSITATRPASDTFTLEMDEITQSDSGVYQCTVSEWNMKSTGDIEKTISKSQITTVAVTQMESFVKVTLISRTNIVTVGDNVELRCRIRGLNMPMTLMWSLQHENASSPDNIVTLYPNGDISWSGYCNRFQLKVESKHNEIVHVLLINGVSLREAGRYQCGVSVFLEKRYKKLPPSYLLAVMVKNPVSKLVVASTPAMTKNIGTDIEIKCSVTAATATSSRFAVTWLVQRQAGREIVVSSDRDGIVTFGPQVELSRGRRITMRRSEGPNFELSIQKSRISDDGSYICEVVEWLQDPHGEWYQLARVSRTTELQIIVPVNDFHLDKANQQLVVSEGDEVELESKLTSSPSPFLFYAITWFYIGPESTVIRVPLVKVNHTGLMWYPENKNLTGLQGRLRLSRPTHSTFQLRIQQAHEGDSGTYQCQVEQYQLNDEGDWVHKASQDAGPITLRVNITDSNLSMSKKDMELNVSRSEGFTIPCHIAGQSSHESFFQVTFFHQEKESKPRPIFTSYRNSTLQDKSGKGGRLRFAHPVPNEFSLAVLNPDPANQELYFCEAEEWLFSLSHGWTKVATEKSGYLTVSVYAEGDFEMAKEPGCSSGICYIILAVVVVVLAIVILMVKMCNTSRGKKQRKDLWASEQHPMNDKPSVEE